MLVVDGEVLVRHPLAEYLRECGYRVLEASDAAEARALIEAHGDVELVLSSAELADESGFALAAWVRAHHPEIQVSLAATIAKAAEKAKDICEDGPAFTKPYDHAQVLDRIRWLLAAKGRGARLKAAS